MIYCTASDMVTQFTELEIAQLTDTSNQNPPAIDSVVLDQNIWIASSEIDARLKSVGSPFSETSGILTKVCCDIARYYMYDDNMNEQVKVLYENAIKFLDRVVNGEAGLGFEAEQLTSTDTAQFDGGDNLFTRENRRGCT